MTSVISRTNLLFSSLTSSSSQGALLHRGSFLIRESLGLLVIAVALLAGFCVCFLGSHKHPHTDLVWTPCCKAPSKRKAQPALLAIGLKREVRPKTQTSHFFSLFILSLMAMLPPKLGRSHRIARRRAPSIYPRNGPSRARVRRYAQRQLREVAAGFL